MKTSRIVVAGITSAIVACSGAVDRENDGTTQSALTNIGRVNVMSRNVYFGANVDAILTASSPEEVPGLVAAMWTQMKNNDFPTRAKAIADEIAGANPDIVGLQEPAIFRRFAADFTPLETIDFLAILQGELTARGLDYHVIVAQDDTDVTVPMLAGSDLEYVQMTDRDAILARGDVWTSEATSGNYAAYIPVTLGDQTIKILRGWTSVVAYSNRWYYRFVETHLDDYVDEVQAGQVMELVEMLAPEKRATVLVGDFNSRADGTGTPVYAYMLASRYTDVWTRANGRAALGYTCCHADDLRTADAPLYERVDFVFVRDRGQSIEGPFSASLVGTTMKDGLWPSDHAGLVASFRLH